MPTLLKLAVELLQHGEQWARGKGQKAIGNWQRAKASGN